MRAETLQDPQATPTRVEVEEGRQVISAAVAVREDQEAT